MIVFLIILSILAGAILVCQYIGVFGAFCEGQIRSKKRLKYWLIPFAPIHFLYQTFVEQYEEMDE